MRNRIIRCRKISGLLLTMAALCIFAVPAQADERQNKVEAAYLYNFFNYITWPGYSSAQALSKPVICVDEGDPILPYLDYVRLKMSPERTITIRPMNGSDEAAGCQLLFVRHRIPAKLLSSIPKDVLLVSKPDDPLDRGGMIELTEEGERISIRINQDMLEQNGFRVSSRLLDLTQRGK